MVEADDTVVAVDLFCGAGGFSEGLRQACEELGYDLEHAGVNHWDTAVETHERNHPEAHQYQSKVEQLHPPDVARKLGDDDDINVDILVGGPSCTHFSRARGGKSIENEQLRASPWHILRWLELLNCDKFLIENVSEIQKWGPLDEDGKPSRDGSIFEAWVTALNALGYAVDWTELNAADYGDPTSRKRFFIIGRQQGTVSFPEPTHNDDDPELPDHRTAAEIIDWSDLGESIWTRDLTQKRVHSPPKDSTMERIAEGVKRHCGEQLAPFAEVLADMGRDEIRELRENRAVPSRYAATAAATLDEPFLVHVPSGDVGSGSSWVTKYNKNSPSQMIDPPLDTIHAKGNHYALSTTESYLLRQQDWGTPPSVNNDPVPTIATRGGHAIVTPSLVMPKNGLCRGLHSNPLYPADERPHHTVTTDPRSKMVTPSLIRWSHGGATLDTDSPMPTIATERGGVFSLSTPYLCPLNNPRPGQRPRTREVDRPLMTVPASKSPAAVATPIVRPFIDDYEGPPKSIDDPLGTVTSKERFALCIPELYPYGLDIHYRMLQPTELAKAQGFTQDYDIAGTKTDKTKQIGNAVPVGLAKSLCKHVLTDDNPSLSAYGGGFSGDDNVDIPDYEDVATDGGPRQREA